jgi:hypothetical protein
MEDDRQMIEDAQLWAIEHGRFPRSRGASVAGAALAEYHRDLPQTIGASSELLGRLGINTGESRTTTRRLLDSAMRELNGGGKESYDQLERSEIMRKTLRDVLVQEAAGHEIERRGGVDPARQLDRDPDRGQGELATATLRRQGVDVDGLFGHMTEHDLVKTSHGSYNKVSLLAHPKLVQALEASEQIMNPEQIAMNRHINAAVEQSTAKETQALPVGRAAIEPRRRFQPAAPVRQPSFGRRVAHMQAMGAGL